MKETSGMKRLTSWATRYKSSLLFLFFLAVAAPFGPTLIGVIGSGPVSSTTTNGTATITLTPAYRAPNPFFGTGSDGAVVLNGVNTYSWASLAGSTYTMSRFVYATTFVVSNGITLNLIQSDYNRVYAVTAKTSIVNNGTISAAGASATNNTAVGGASCSGVIGCGQRSGAGNTGSANGVSGAALTNLLCLGGAGGAGGTAGIRTGGTGGTCTDTNAKGGNNGIALILGSINSSSFVYQPGLGGGGGGNLTSSTATSGAGGGGGSGIHLVAPSITNNGVITANGGDGASGVTAGDGSGSGGGGGGGGGGYVVIYADTFTGNAPTVAGGSGGAGYNTGAAGTPGAAGTVTYFTN